MRVAVISDSLPPRVDGIAVVVTHLVAGLVRHGHDVLLIGPGAKTSSGVRSVCLPAVRTPFDGYPLSLPWRRRVNRALESFRPEVISIQTIGPVAILGLSWAARYGIRVLFHWHTDFESYARTYPVARVVAFFACLVLVMDRYWSGGVRRPWNSASPAPGKPRIIARTLWLATSRAVAVCAPCRGVVPQIRAFGVRCPVFVLPADVTEQELGVDGFAARLALARIPGGGGRPYVLYVGRLSREKNLQLLLDAFVRVVASDSRALLVLVGPEHDSRTQAMLKPYLQAHHDRIVSLGSHRRDELGEIYRRATVFVTPSLSETQCLCVSEAISLDVPVLVVDPRLAEDRPLGAVQVVEPVPARLAAAIADHLNRARSGTASGSQAASGRWAGFGRSSGPDLAARFVVATGFAQDAQDDVTYRWRGGRWLNQP